MRSAVLEFDFQLFFNFVELDCRRVSADLESLVHE